MPLAACRLRLPRADCLNQPPGMGAYMADVLLDEQDMACRKLGRTAVEVQPDGLELHDLPDIRGCGSASKLYFDF